METFDLRAVRWPTFIHLFLHLIPAHPGTTFTPMLPTSGLFIPLYNISIVQYMQNRGDEIPS